MDDVSWEEGWAGVHSALSGQIYAIYLERADTDEEQVYLGDVLAYTMSDALDLGAQFYEVPSHDLVAIQESN